MGIYTDQVGYFTNSDKIAVATFDGDFCLCKKSTNGNDEKIKKLVAVNDCYDETAGENVWQLDFSDVMTPGKYYICGTDTEGITVNSHTFCIADDIYDEIIKAMSKCFYYQRCGCSLDKKFAGAYTHGACHTDKVILFNDYVNKVSDPKYYDICGGWHDAGDYGRYSTAAAVALGHLLYAYELYPQSFDFSANIPESGNGIPDILNECRYELDWLMKMQTLDGGVYHKLTAYRHAPFVMPEEDKDQFLLYDVSSMAVADFVAIMCIASRIYKKYDKDFSKKAFDAAKLSYEWLKNHDYTGFTNPLDSHTGEYGDNIDLDERLWAAAEMLRTDSEDNSSKYIKVLEKYIELLGTTGKENEESLAIDFGWADVAGFAVLSVLSDDKHHAGEKIVKVYKERLIEKADLLCELTGTSGYKIFMEAKDYVWGSNMLVGNRSMIMMLAAKYCDDNEKASQYRKCSEDAIHYLLGRNAIDRSYVTGFGENAFGNPHNRPTACDGIDAVMPGWVSGGPLRTPMDPDAIKLIPEGTAPMKCHADVVGSYSTNEITIYWNSPFVFVLAALKN